ncbi:UNVERIFIED_CONTAM: hypothetical protein GTU68_063299 [Idotea baltica]|nr:hypothetical protein [Idotea baltica]
MELHNLKPAEGSVKKGKRVGRGQGSTRGGTSTRGHKGAQSRSGYSRKRGFEGGQMPLQMRIPKRGFKNINRINYIGFNLDTVSMIAEAHGIKEFSFEKLRELGIVQRNDKVKILGRGELKTALTFKVHAYTAKAKEAIAQVGGTIQEN